MKQWNYYFNSQPWIACFVNTLHDEMGRIHKALLLHSKVQWWAQGKALVWLLELKFELATLSYHTTFTWIKQMIIQIWVCDICVLKNEWSEPDTSKRIIIFVDSDKIQNFKWQNSGKLAFTTMSLTASKYLNIFLMIAVMILMIVIF